MFAPGDRVVPHHHAPCLACRGLRGGPLRALRRVALLAPRSGRHGRARADPGRQPLARHAEDPRRRLGRGGELHRAARDRRQGVSARPVRGGPVRSRASASARRGSSPCAWPAPRGADRDRRRPTASRSRLALARASGADGRRRRRTREPLAAGARRLSQGRGFDFVFVGPGKAEVIREAARGGRARRDAARSSRWRRPARSGRRTLYDLYFREIAVVPSYSCGPDDTREALARDREPARRRRRPRLAPLRASPTPSRRSRARGSPRAR